MRRSPNTHVEDNYFLERGAVLATAVGVARLQLHHEEWVKALETLDNAVDKLHRMHWDACVADGHDPAQVDLLLGPRERVPAGSSLSEEEA